ncbi:hypothetical protein CPB84DRAFT_1846116 [Gymnopilus junonius]|uniref:Uncharacterized protein n=1 Tax=Gymnopilus junonius TaxID=109634 RepID=A0A9P5NS66_GYMJU|nr:hypothetical protein CPB84DRAFT_1846116 [Gymnopilus junonius]
MSQSFYQFVPCLPTSFLILAPSFFLHKPSSVLAQYIGPHNDMFFMPRLLIDAGWKGPLNANAQTLTFVAANSLICDTPTSLLNTGQPVEPPKRKWQRANATSSSDRNKKKACTSATAVDSTSAPPFTSSVIGVGPHPVAQPSSSTGNNPTYAAIEKALGKVKSKAE